MKICFDLDGVITKGIYTHPEYEKCEPNEQVIALMRDLDNSGHYIYIQTARWKEDRDLTEAWLKKYNVPYFDIFFGKPYSDIYVDDKAIRYTTFLEVDYKIREEIERGS